ncbi:STAS domain-containing protein [Chamaesiphon sp. OTE_75_metabat_556]|jgi:anti-anti-sigma factor|uniref:STAS domain-containing protein n=1 Tax=Chamaesiphon sp. OTE_75_metabat_556 TaxID=2964692 RepID=UPI00286AFD16|nr:STAS domain-containing protein [Chamaesiphon sp. OTE_75_metabat_556]
MAAPLKIIKPAGIIDSVQANELCNQVSALLATGHNLVLLDMSDVNFIDSSGLSALIIALKMLRSAGGDLYLCSIAAPVRDLLNITRMDRLFDRPQDSRFEYYCQDTEYSELKSC